ncbi:AAA family ATPase [Phormidium sp. CCY1219]|uniref:AAA family ATPase n=1 Tax=Phormidium sp. CCY1219 TaxID=2886104 RepID=UPI002D1EC70C|nr:AAA family ATPase [Phormidium sp. CCY1219]MEB3831005.1 AAA family ATPase [Phormidium sp. CCY1219]
MPPANSNSPSDRPRSRYDAIAIEGFRQFKHLNLNNLGKINLFFGPNNAGKSSILEAIYTHACGLNLAAVMGQVVLNRADNAVSGPLDLGEKIFSLFRDTSSLPYTFTLSAKTLDTPSPYLLKSSFHPAAELSLLDPLGLGQLSGSFSSQTRGFTQLIPARSPTAETRSQHRNIPDTYLGKWSVEFNGEKLENQLYFPQFQFEAKPQFRSATLHEILDHRTLGEDLRIFSQLKRYDIFGQFIAEMKQAFPEVLDIDLIPYPNGTPAPVAIATTDGRRLPLYSFGDGMRRWFYLLGQMLIFQNGVHCIEELEVTLHPAAQSPFIPLLVKYANEFNNQLFVTSHSIEFADSFLEALYGENGAVVNSEEDPVRIFTIKPSAEAGIPEVWPLTGREAYESRHKYELELR